MAENTTAGPSRGQGGRNHPVRWLAGWLITLFLAWPLPTLAHAVRGATLVGKAVCLKACYDDGAPMSYARVEIAAPAARLPFQSGRSDRNGVFCFRPDRQGDWQLTISDSMGHRLKQQVRIGQELLPAPAPTPAGRSGGCDKLTGTVLGLALIFTSSALAGCWLRSRRQEKRESG